MIIILAERFFSLILMVVMARMITIKMVMTITMIMIVISSQKLNNVTIIVRDLKEQNCVQ